MGDAGSNLYSIDLRTGGVLYGYRGEYTQQPSNYAQNADER